MCPVSSWKLLACASLCVVLLAVAGVDAIRGCRDCGGGAGSDEDYHQHRIHFPEEEAVLAEREAADGEYPGSQIPLSMIMRLNSITNTSQLFEEFIQQPPVLLGSRLGPAAEETHAALATRGIEQASYLYEVDVERNAQYKAQKLEVEAASVPKPALCQPEIQTVKLKSSDDPSLFYFPSCTRLERCGGCCSHELLSCQPISTEPMSFQVVVTQFVGNNQMVYKGKEVIIVEKHTKCKCDCTVKASDCNPLQVYEKNECRCKCANTEKQKKCENESATKLWDPKSCSCQCREVQECSTGLIWDNLRCSCVPTPRTKNRIGQDAQDRTRYRLGADRS
nr:PREDICTED: uncharacterized protein LOC109029884 isoform X1 [Bemisia tabaci]